MRTSNPSMIAARQRADLMSRDVVCISGRDRETNEIVWLNLWSGVGNVTIPVLDIDTGASVDKIVLGNSALLAVDQMVFVCEQEITDRTISIQLNKARRQVDTFVRVYDLHEQEVFVYQGDFDPKTKRLVAPAECVFAGYVDTAPITTGAAGDSGSIEIEVRSAITEMTRSNTLKRSHACEVLRDPTDTFYQDTPVVGDWVTYLGQDTPKPIKSA